MNKQKTSEERDGEYVFSKEPHQIIASGYSSRFQKMMYFRPGFLEEWFSLQLYFNTH